MPGVGVGVTLHATPTTNVVAYAVEESFPSGWTVSAVSHGGAVDPVQRAIKWGPFTDTIPVSRVLAYTVTPPVGEREAGHWRGEGRFNTERVLTTGNALSARYPGTLALVLPPEFVPGQPVLIRVNAEPASDVNAYAVEVGVPAGWSVTLINESGQWDLLNDKVKWGPFTDATPRSRELTFTVTPPANGARQVSFQARAVMDAVELTVSGSLGRRPSRVTPSMPGTYVPGTPILVELEVDPAPFVEAHAVELAIPAGWVASGISHSGVLDLAEGKVKWGPFLEDTPLRRVLTASLMPPTGAEGMREFMGVGVFDDETVAFGITTDRYWANQESSVKSELPSEHEAGTSVTVVLRVSPRDGDEVYSVEDTLPEGWELVSADSGGAYDSVNRKVKWGPFYAPETVARQLTYRARSTGASIGDARFEGVGWFGGVFRTIDGDRVTTVLPGRLSRVLPPRYTPGVEFLGQLDANPGPGIGAYAVEEQVPVGWGFVGATEGGIYDPVNRLVKWGPFSDRVRRTLEYRLVPPSGVAATTQFSGRAAFGHSLVDSTGASQAVRNSAPRVIPNTAGRTPGEAFKISVIKILLNDSDDDGDFLSVVGVSPTSAHGAEVVLAWPWIFYTPPEGFNGVDTFGYTVSDGFGGVTIGLLQVVVNPPPTSAQNILQIESLPNGTRRVRFTGVPGFTYHIEASTNLTTWIPLGDVVAEPNGQFEYLDLNATLFPVRYYRSIWP